MIVTERHAKAPSLCTARLNLRAHHLNDFSACAAMWADPAITRFIGGRPFAPDETWARIMRYAGHWMMLGFGYWLIEETGSGQFVGEAGFADLRRNLGPAFDGAPEIGWALAQSAQGKGYAAEAVRALVDWGGAQFPGARTVCMIHPDNTPSLRVAEKNGYVAFARTIYKGAETILFERPGA